jgi:hypothetical protein
LDHTYFTLIESELHRKSKKNKTPALSYERPKYIFPTEESIELICKPGKLDDNERDLVFENMKKGWEVWQF